MRTLALPRGSGAVSRLLCMPNGRSLIIGSGDILRQWDLAHVGKGQPFTIITGHYSGNSGDQFSELGMSRYQFF